MTTPQMDWLDDQRRKRAVSSDDIVTRLRSENRMVMAPLHMSDAADEIERLRAEVERLRALGDALADAAIRQQWSRLDVARGSYDEETLYDAVAEIKRLRAEIERLRALGDALADAAIRQQWSRLDVAVAAWHEARRG